MLNSGLRIIEDASLVDLVEDWSQVRSPARARRRRAKYPQRIRVYYKPKPDVFVIEAQGVMVMHPEIAKELRRKMSASPSSREVTTPTYPPARSGEWRERA
jgi:hypothetical protein